jgi:hypothetical protein
MMQLTLAEINTMHEKARDVMISDSSAGEKYRAAQELYAIYSSITGITIHTHTDTSLSLPTGSALSARAAAHCLLEFARTASFLRGIQQAIRDLQQRFPGERLRILYAGCGPYASLVTPLLSCYQPSELTLDLLDVTPRSIDAVRQLYQVFGLTGYVNSYLLCDATSYKIEGESPVRLLISETLNAGLRNEPFVSIMQNLVPQLPEGSIVIPEQITVDAVYLRLKQETERFMNPDIVPERTVLGQLACFNQSNIQTPAAVTFTIPPIDLVANRLHLMTNIHVYGKELLKEYDCSLTLPAAVKLSDATGGDNIRFTYQIGEKPRFVPELVKN